MKRLPLIRLNAVIFILLLHFRNIYASLLPNNHISMIKNSIDATCKQVTHKYGI